MPEPKVRFKRDDGNSYPAWVSTRLSDLFQRINERNNGQFDNTKWISVAKMYYQNPDKVQSNNIDTRTYVMRYGDIAFEGHPNDEFMYGRFVLNDIGDGVISELFPIYRFRKEYVLKYWKYAIQVEKVMAPVYRKAITSSGASSNKLNEEDFLRESIYVPCLEEQQKIADFLSSVDEVITASEEEVANLEKQKKAVMKKIFSQEVRFKRADGTDFPEWETRKMSDGFYIKSRVGWQALSREEYLSSGDYYLVTGTDITNNNVDYKRCWYVSKERYDMDTNIQIRNGDIIITKDGTIGKVAQINGLDKPATLNSHLFLVRDESNETLNTYLLYVFLSPVFTDFVNATKTGSTLTGLPLKTFIEFNFPVPCLEEQRLIADFLSDFDEAIATAKKELELWKELKKGLLQQMFV